MIMLDLGSIGPTFTWFNERKGLTYVKERLGHAIGNIEWKNLFHEAVFYVLTTERSDHAPISSLEIQSLPNCRDPLDSTTYG